MHAEEITEILAVTRSKVSTSLRELVTLSLARTVHLHGDRRDHFETSKDVQELFRTATRKRKGQRNASVDECGVEVERRNAATGASDADEGDGAGWQDPEAAAG